MADEETGNTYGIKHILEYHADLFEQDDLFLVPDSGTPEGDEVEIAEKSMLWARIIVNGRQCHASRPEQGNNSLLAASDLILGLRSLYERFDARNMLFTPPYSTFEATKKEANVENINTIPGRDVFYLDCRILPQYEVDDVLSANQWTRRLSYVTDTECPLMWKPFNGTRVRIPLSEDSPVVARLQAAIREHLCVEPHLVGIGGGTVANLLRQRGYQAVVWSRIMHNAHQPDEKGSINFTPWRRADFCIHSFCLSRRGA